GADNSMLITDENGDVVWVSIEDIVKANTTNELTLDDNQLTSTVNGVSSSVTLTDANITSDKGITSNTIDLTGQAGATLKNVTMEIKPGTDGQVMITEGGVATWVDQSEIVPTTINELTKKEGTNGNTIVSKVNGVEAEEVLVESVTNTLTGTNLVTSVNGVPSTSVDLKDAIQAGQKTVEVVSGVNTTVTTGGSGDHTTYAVNVSEDAIQNNQLVTEVAAGTGVIVTTSNPSANTTVYTVSANPSEIALGGDVTGNANATTLSAIQGTPVVANGTKEEGQALVFDGTSWIPGKPKVDASDITDAKDLTAADGNEATIEIVEGGEKAVLVETSLRVKDGSIKTVKLADKAVTAPKMSSQIGTEDGGASINAPVGAVPTADGNGGVEYKQVPRFFYMPAVIFNTTVTGNNLERNLHLDYVNQFTGGAVGSANQPYAISHGAPTASVLTYSGGLIASEGAPTPDIVTYKADELAYYITYYDQTVFAGPDGTGTPRITSDGKLQYSIIGNATPASYMNIVFVIK
ncbi:hypothetical protein, partial [Sphingobacterium wenxiniae]